jgi:hypothetical protein
MQVLTHEHPSTGQGSEVVEALDVIMIGSAVVPLTILGFVIWYFFRASRRNDEREAAEAQAAELPALKQPTPR